jgi:hypothetical protein
MPPAPRAPGEHGQGLPLASTDGNLGGVHFALRGRLVSYRRGAVGHRINENFHGYFNLKQPLAAHAGHPKSPLNRGCHVHFVSRITLRAGTSATLHFVDAPRITHAQAADWARLRGRSLGVGHPKNTALRQGANRAQRRSGSWCACAPMSARQKTP